MKHLVVSACIISLLLVPIYIHQEAKASEAKPLEKVQKQLIETHENVSRAHEELQDILVEHEKLLEERRRVEEERRRVEEERNKSAKLDPIFQVDYKETLKELGYYRRDHKDEETNYRDSVLRFQSDHNLTVDGIFGSKSTEALYRRLQDENYQYPDKIQNPPSDGLWIVVNKTKRILTLYKGDEVIKKYPIAQGKSPSLTPEGKFTIVTKSINPAWGGAGIAAPVAGGAPNNPLGRRWLGLSHGGGGRYGIHGNSSPRSIGTDASLGCVRMINSDVEALYDLIPLRTIAWIGTEKQLQEWGVNQISYIEVELRNN
ncbi:L,D-transpeptidase family protein [Alkaliphilus transvaalensis]|uniref:L,D-transpeptidase family protein n=1 Tax=Alkaliphilus transvaalensis TaxID=114628 RepID=UPI000686316D|nr:L,D-transpeptidase family protein [Alkaliphilus transvaalensis]